jgi:hypothetical protein
MTRVLLCLILWHLTSCRHEPRESLDGVVRYVGGKQVLSVNHVGKDGQPLDSVMVLALNKDTVAIGDKISFRLYLSDPRLRLVGAYYMDDISDQSLADTTWVPQDNSVAGVDISTGNPLPIENDTARIEFRVAGPLPGPRLTNKITLLSMDRERIIRFHSRQLPYVAE